MCWDRVCLSWGIRDEGIGRVGGDRILGCGDKGNWDG